jgi:organic radical activating enzyme
VRRGYLSEIFASFQGEGLYAGRRHLFLRLSGCHLRCRYCDTPGSLQRSDCVRVHRPDGQVVVADNPLSAGDVLAHAKPLLDGGHLDGVAVTGGEPLLQGEFVAEVLSDARWPRPRLLETSGTQPDKLAAVLPVIDIVSMDIKLASNTGERSFWEEHREFLALAGRKAYVKILVDETTTVADVERAAQTVGRRATPVFLQPITDVSGRVSIGAAALERFFSVSKEHVDDLLVLPQTHKMLGIQ